MAIYNIGGNDYELVLEERKNKVIVEERRNKVIGYENALYIDLEDVENRRGIDGTYIFPGRIDTQAEDCYIPEEGMFTMLPDDELGDRLNAREWSIKSSDQYVDNMINKLIDRFIFRGNPEYNSEQEVPEGLEDEIRGFLDPRILHIFREQANKQLERKD